MPGAVSALWPLPSARRRLQFLPSAVSAIRRLRVGFLLLPVYNKCVTVLV